MNPLEHIRISPICDLCGSDVSKNGARVAAGRQQVLGVSIPLSTVVCRRCRFIFQPERFSDALLTALYEHDTSFAVGEAEKEMPIVKACLVERQAVISTALSAHGIAAGAAVLDLGGGRGECCQHLVPRYRVVVADTTDCPPADPRIEKLHGLDFTKVDGETFDVVVMNHILEHVFSPTALLASARKVLKEGGILIVEVPSELYTPLVARHLGDWRHVGYFCRTTLSQFLEKSGFLVERLALVRGCYGRRRLPVIRAVASRHALTAAHKPGHNSPLVLVADMLMPAAVGTLASRVLRR